MCVHVEQEPDIMEGVRYKFTSHNKERLIKILHIIFRSDSIPGRGSIVAEAECICEECSAGQHCHLGGRILVIKLSLPCRGRVPENTLIDEARTYAILNNEQWALNHLPRVLESIAIPFPEDSAQEQLRIREQTTEERVLRFMILERLEPLALLEKPEEFAQVFYDILQIHRWLYLKVGILHRDLSPANIMIRRIDGKVYGVLNDFDLSSRVDGLNKGATSKSRTGTAPFMAIDLLREKWQLGHFYRHDVESLFYIILCIAGRYKLPGILASEREYSKWFRGNEDDVYDRKSSFLFAKEAEKVVVKPFFRGFKLWLEGIFLCFQLGYGARLAKRLSGNLDDFDQDTMDDHVTYEKMQELMRSFEGKALETRWEEDRSEGIDLN